MDVERTDAIANLALGAAHDLRNLLFIIAAHSQQLAETLDADDVRGRHLAAIDGATSRAGALADQILAAGKGTAPPVRPVDLTRLVDGLAALLDGLAGERITIVTDLTDPVWPLRANTTQIEQVLINLAVNARDAMPEGGALTITTTNRAAAGGAPDDWVALTVTDTGHGMTDQARAQMFEPFFTTRRTGTGIGLATVRSIVTAAGGRIEVESAPGAGTSVTVLWPRARHASADAVAHASATAGLGGARILIVEDEPSIRALLVQCLEEQGYELLVAGSAAEALALCRATDAPIDLVVTDLMLPDALGSDLARQVRERAPWLPVVLMSGSPEVIDAPVDGASCRVLSKPFSFDDFNRAVGGALAAAIPAAGRAA